MFPSNETNNSIHLVKTRLWFVPNITTFPFPAVTEAVRPIAVFPAVRPLSGHSHIDAVEIDDFSSVFPLSASFPTLLTPAFPSWDLGVFLGSK